MLRAVYTSINPFIGDFCFDEVLDKSAFLKCLIETTSIKEKIIIKQLQQIMIFYCDETSTSYHTSDGNVFKMSDFKIQKNIILEI